MCRGAGAPVGWLGAWGAVRWRPPLAGSFIPVPSGTLPGSPAACGPRGTLPALRPAVLSATFWEICVSGACGSAFFRPPAALGLRPVPCCSLARGLRSAPRSVGVPGHVLAGLVWLSVCACSVLAGCVLFAPGLWLARARPVAALRWGLYGGRARSLGLCGWGVRLLGAFCLRLEKRRTFAQKWPESPLSVCLSVAARGMRRKRGGATAPHPREAGRASAPFNSTIENTITRFSTDNLYLG